MEHRWSLRCTTPELIVPVPVDPAGRSGPTGRDVRRVAWRRSSPRLFVPVEADRGVVEQRILEEAMRLPPDGAVSGWAALRMAGGNFFDGTVDGRAERPVDLVVPPPQRLREVAGIRVHRAALRPEEVLVRHGVPCAVPARAAFDEVMWCRDLRQGVGVLDMALSARLLTRPQMAAEVQRRAGERGAALVRAALELAEDRVLSPKETVGRLIWVLDAGLPRPRCNWPVADARGRRIGKPDLLCEELDVAGEYDGADHRDADRHADDVGKEDRYRNVGLEAFRIVGRDLVSVERVVRRMHAAVARSRASTLPRTYVLAVNPPPVCRP